MRYAVNLPILGEYSDPNVLVELACEAEAANWDAVFVWDSLLFDVNMHPPIADPWITLAAIASQTKKIKIGTMIAQPARRRPSKLAREVATLDHLSNGRMIFGVGLGFSGQAEFEQFGEDGDAKVRADKLDECLDILVGLWTGEPFSYDGTYHKVKEGTVFLPRPVQQPHPPIWVGGYWPNKRPFRRAAKWDGAAPAEVEVHENGLSIVKSTPETVAAIKSYIMENRTESGDYDIILSHNLPEDEGERAASLKAYEQAGVTWMLQDMFPWEVPLEKAHQIIRRGPLRS